LGLSNAILAVFERFELLFAAFMPRILISDCFYAEKAPKSFILLDFLKTVIFTLFWAHFGAQKRHVSSF
jgi:hypothetical protein